MGIFRFFHTSALCKNISKSTLGLLRKKTGYSLANCRKALEMHDNDATKAEKWLNDQAKTLGWSKVMKVQDRKTPQGLVGVAVNNKKIAMVEVNCETDFVSRNNKFRSIVELAATTCLQLPILTSGMNTNKVSLNANELGKLKAHDHSLADHLAILTGSIGENMILRRAFCYETTRDDLNIAVAVHPPTDNSEVLLGKYGSFLCYQCHPEMSSTNIGVDLCKHIIGMNPVKIGEFGKDEPSENVEDEKILIYQEFLLDPSETVGQLLMDSGISIVDFERFECGEPEKEKFLSEENNDKGVNIVEG